MTCVEAIKTHDEKLSHAALSVVRSCKHWAFGTLATNQCVILYFYNKSSIFISYLLIRTFVIGINPTGSIDIMDNTEVLTDT
jgi:hypothetical protein